MGYYAVVIKWKFPAWFDQISAIALPRSAWLHYDFASGKRLLPPACLPYDGRRLCSAAIESRHRTDWFLRFAELRLLQPCVTY